MSITNTKAIIMAGGTGTRFWPQSRESFPKQFLDILNTGRSLFQMTVDRFLTFLNLEDIYVITLATYEKMILEQFPTFPKKNMFLEPQGKNTALSVAYPSFEFYQSNPNANLIFSPADHLIQQTNNFASDCKQILNSQVITDSIITIGIKPFFPNTGFGYIKFDSSKENDEKIYNVVAFTEKPSLDIAKKFLASGNYLWNAGLFMSKAKNFVQGFRQHYHVLAHAFDKIKIDNDKRFPKEHIKEIFKNADNISIDYALMEKIENANVMTASFDWSDLGTWSSVYDNIEKDKDENALIGQNIFLENANSNIIKMPKGKLAFINGLDDFIVVDTNDVLLICRKSNEQKVKEYREKLKKENLNKFL